MAMLAIPAYRNILSNTAGSGMCVFGIVEAEVSTAVKMPAPRLLIPALITVFADEYMAVSDGVASIR